MVKDDFVASHTTNYAELLAPFKDSFVPAARGEHRKKERRKKKEEEEEGRVVQHDAKDFTLLYFFLAKFPKYEKNRKCYKLHKQRNFCPILNGHRDRSGGYKFIEWSRAGIISSAYRAI